MCGQRCRLATHDKGSSVPAEGEYILKGWMSSPHASLRYYRKINELMCSILRGYKVVVFKKVFTVMFLFPIEEIKRGELSKKNLKINITC